MTKHESSSIAEMFEVDNDNDDDDDDDDDDADEEEEDDGRGWGIAFWCVRFTQSDRDDTLFSCFILRGEGGGGSFIQILLLFIIYNLFFCFIYFFSNRRPFCAECPTLVAASFLPRTKKTAQVVSPAFSRSPKKLSFTFFNSSKPAKCWPRYSVPAKPSTNTAETRNFGKSIAGASGTSGAALKPSKNSKSNFIKAIFGWANSRKG